MSKPSDPERQLIQRLRQRLRDMDLSPEALQDHELIRWIRVILPSFQARNHDLDKAEQMFRKSHAWRSQNAFEDLVSWVPPKVVTDVWKLHFPGLDSENTPIILSTLDANYLKSILDSNCRMDFVGNAGHGIESALQLAKGKLTPEGFPVTQVIIIADYKWLPLSMVFSPSYISFLLDIFGALEANFPERIQKIANINCGKAMSAAYNLVKPIMAESTRNKLGICSTADPEFLQKFAPTIDPALICPCWGGTKPCTYDTCPL